MSRTLEIDGGYNLRDLGDYPTRHQRFTRRRVLIRGGNLDKVSDAGQQQLLDYGVRTIIDLRDEWEVEKYPTLFSQKRPINYLNLPLIGARLADDAAWTALAQDVSLATWYVRYVEHCQIQIGEIIAAVAESPAATLFHCHAGKDRTGIIAALLLGAVGVSKQAIIEDYVQTSSQITHLTEAWRAYAVQNGHDLERLKRESASEPETMHSLLNYLHEQYGGVTGYLKTCGVSVKHLERLRTQFVG